MLEDQICGCYVSFHQLLRMRAWLAWGGGRMCSVRCFSLPRLSGYCCPLLLLRRSLLLHLLMGHGSLMAPAVPSAPA